MLKIGKKREQPPTVQALGVNDIGYIFGTNQRVVLKHDGLHVLLEEDDGITISVPLSKMGSEVVAIGQPRSRRRLKFVGLYRVSDGVKVPKAGAKMYFAVLSLLRKDADQDWEEEEEEEEVDSLVLDRELRSSLHLSEAEFD